MSGEPLRDRLRRIFPQERSRLAADLKCCFDQLRSLPVPSSGPQVCGFSGGSFRCYRFDFDNISPFTTELDLYEYLYEHVYLNQRTRLEAFARKVHLTPHRFCLTHNDLSPTNILVDDNHRLGMCRLAPRVLGIHEIVLA